MCFPGKALLRAWRAVSCAPGRTARGPPPASRARRRGRCGESLGAKLPGSWRSPPGCWGSGRTERTRLPAECPRVYLKRISTSVIAQEKPLLFRTLKRFIYSNTDDFSATMKSIFLKTHHEKVPSTTGGKKTQSSTAPPHRSPGQPVPPGRRAGAEGAGPRSCPPMISAQPSGQLWGGGVTPMFKF